MSMAADFGRSAVLVGVFELVHERGQYFTELRVVAAHQYGILKRILAKLPDIVQIFAQHFEFLYARNDLALRRAPYGFRDIGHVGDYQAALRETFVLRGRISSVSPSRSARLR